MKLLLSVFLSFLSVYVAFARMEYDDLFRRIFTYERTVKADKTLSDSLFYYNYHKYLLSIDRRNVTLLAVPSLYSITRGHYRFCIGEVYDEVINHKNREYPTGHQASISSVPRLRKILPTIQNLIRPRLYDEVMFKDNILSPFNKLNKRYYKYRIKRVEDNVAEISFSPQINNTQLVTGRAEVDVTSGRIISCRLEGEYDMIDFTLNITPGKRGYSSLEAEKCRLEACFRFLGNKLRADYHFQKGLTRSIPSDSVMKSDFEKMEYLRPLPLTKAEKMYYAHLLSLKAQKQAEDSLKKDTVVKKSDFIKDVLWDKIGDNLINQIKYNFGSKSQGTFRLGPIFNPLYMSYSDRRGVTYKSDLRLHYLFSPNAELSMRFKSGYSFKQKRFYYQFPVEWYFDKKRNGYLEFETGNGNYIVNHSILRDLEDNHIAFDTLKDKHLDLSRFKNNYTRLTLNYEFNDKLELKLGMVYHKRSAVDPRAFTLVNMPHVYRSLAPTAELKYRPWGWVGPLFSAKYERGLKGPFGANTVYENWEFDAQYLMQLTRLQSLSIKIGSGFYTHKDPNAYFLDYSNFWDNNIPGGWNDEWSGEFELLESEFYNLSEYYVRSNFTYEAPLLIMSRLPVVGRFLEIERLYLNMISVRQLNPHIEIGYGFRTRFFSLGVFSAFREWKYHSTGIKFGFELFRQW